MGLKLFDGSDDDVGDISKIGIDKEFARRYEHNKKREGLQRLEELKKKGLAGSDSDSESDESSSDEGLVSSVSLGKKGDLDFLNALIKARKQDPIFRDKNVKLYESESDDHAEGTEEEEEGRQKVKPMYLKDVTAKHLIEEGPEFEEKEDKSRVKSYSEEQEDLKKAILDATQQELGGDCGELFQVKDDALKADDDDHSEGSEIQKKIDEYFGEGDNMDEDEKHMKDFFKTKMWLMDNMDEVNNAMSSESELERTEDYERQYNFRFEEKAGDRVLGHSRVVEGSVRKKTDTRKLQRKRKEERMAQAEFERKEELKHLKNLKKNEMNEKLRKIRETAGFCEDRFCPLDEEDFEKEFDPDEYDGKMRKAFDDDYYDAEDADPEFGSQTDEEGGEFEKPDFDKEDELLGLPKGWDDMHKSGDGFLAARERALKRRADNDTPDDQIDGGKRKKKHKMSTLEKNVLDKELEEYYKLDYEDTVGDLKTRFKYKEVAAQRYGLNPEELLLMDENELNQYVSMKKLAPYREKEWKVPRIKIYNQKQKNKLLLEGENSKGRSTGKRTLRGDDKRLTTMAGALQNGKTQVEESNDDMSRPSKRSKRRHRQAELKLSQSRLMAYGKIPSKSESKKKKH